MCDLSTIRCNERHMVPPLSHARSMMIVLTHEGCQAARHIEWERKGKGRSEAAVCRDRDEQFLGSSSLVIDGVEDLAALEAIACWEGMALAEDLNIHEPCYRMSF